MALLLFYVRYAGDRTAYLWTCLVASVPINKLEQHFDEYNKRTIFQNIFRNL